MLKKCKLYYFGVLLRERLTHSSNRCGVSAVSKSAKSRSCSLEDIHRRARPMVIPQSFSSAVEACAGFSLERTVMI